MQMQYAKLRYTTLPNTRLHYTSLRYTNALLLRVDATTLVAAATPHTAHRALLTTRGVESEAPPENWPALAPLQPLLLHPPLPNLR